ncbi:hypothetical protein [Nocardia sp. NPDC051570]|uniref:hypothetical protein n=1 Tax=Nocardia sp. NPDC051570 TaxID=3364324 RepID=UPI0037BD538E
MANRRQSSSGPQFPDIGQNLLMPVDFGPNAHPRMFDDQIVGYTLIRPAPFDPARPRPQGRETILEVAVTGVRRGA